MKGYEINIIVTGDFCPHGRVVRRLLKFELFRNMILKKNRLQRLLGIIRCEAHRDIAVRILEQIIAEK